MSEDFSELKRALTEASVSLGRMNEQLRLQTRIVDELRTKMQSSCKHEKIEWKRESGHYGQRYHECPECLKIW
jgi:hypothetical protein